MGLAFGGKHHPMGVDIKIINQMMGAGQHGLTILGRNKPIQNKIAITRPSRSHLGSICALPVKPDGGRM